MADIPHRALVQYRFVRDVTIDAGKQWLDDRASRMAAALAFYMIFSAAPSFVIVVAIGSSVFGDVAAREAAEAYLRDYVGPTGIEVIVAIAEQATREGVGPLMTLAGAAVLVVAATAAFSELHDALNMIWKAPTRTGLKGLVHQRLVGFLIVVGIGLLFLISVAISAVLSLAHGIFDAGSVPVQELFSVFDFLVSFLLGMLAFSAIYYYVPDTGPGLRAALMGGLITAVLFTPGKMLLALYLGTIGMQTVYGTAGSFVTVLVWIYYSALVFFFGAEWTRSFAVRSAARTP